MLTMYCYTIELILPKYCPNIVQTFVQILPKYQTNIIQMLSWYCPNIVKILSKTLTIYCQNIVWILPGYCPNISKYCTNIIPILSQYCLNIVQILCKYCLNIVKILNKHPIILYLWSKILIIESESVFPIVKDCTLIGPTWPNPALWLVNLGRSWKWPSRSWIFLGVGASRP